jgi:hypothetical protein
MKFKTRDALVCFFLIFTCFYLVYFSESISNLILVINSVRVLSVVDYSVVAFYVNMFLGSFFCSKQKLMDHIMRRQKGRFLLI